jgi:uncharacterized delta-60 repeat protein
MALQRDGRILLLGGLKLLRFNSDGTPDTSFGTGGLVTVPFNGSAFDLAQGLTVQADGKIVVVGGMTVAGQEDFALARFNADGTLDTGFGSGGRVTTDFSGLADRARRVVIQADGKIVVAGSTSLAIPPPLAKVDSSFGVARYNADGSLDPTFDLTGKGRYGIASIDFAQGLALQADGKIVVVGRTAPDGGSVPNVGMIRILVDTPPFIPGTLDETFGVIGNGTVNSNLGLPGGRNGAEDVVVNADGSLLVVFGVRGGGAHFNFGLARFTSFQGRDGLLSAGPLLTAFSTQDDFPRAMTLQADGKVIVVGQSANLSANADMAIARYSVNGGSLDTTFGNAGKVNVDFFGARDEAQAVAVQADGRIIVAGWAVNGGVPTFAMARLMP